MFIISLLIAAIGGYMLGSVPFGLVLTRAAGLGDIRQIGSKNIGATNVLRTGRKDLALATLLLDSFKAGLAVYLLATISGDRNVGLIAGAFAFLGHCYPVWLKFKGGKGVATYAGLLVFASPLALAVGAPIWLGLFAHADFFAGGAFGSSARPVWRSPSGGNPVCCFDAGSLKCSDILESSRKYKTALEWD